MHPPVPAESLQALLRDVNQHFRRALRSSPRALAYVAERSIAPELLARYQVGYAREAPRDLGHVLARHPHPAVLASKLLVDGSRAEDRPRDRFRDRLIFPIRNLQGTVVGFAGRTLGDASTKYVISADGFGFRGSELLFGLHEAQADIRWKRRAFVVKGYFDTLAMVEAGHTNTVGLIDGIVHSAQLAALLTMCDHVSFCLDGRLQSESMVTTALLAAAPLLRPGCSFDFVRLDGEHDPESLLKHLGTSVLAVALRHPQPFLRTLEDTIGSGCDLDSIEGKQRCSYRAGAYWNVLPLGREREALVALCADLLQLESEQVVRLWTRNHGRVPVADRPHDD